LKTIPVDTHAIVSMIAGRSLSAVTFVMDYVQLDFHGSGFTLYVWPEVSTATSSYKYQQPGYRDALCEQIDKVVTEVSPLTDNDLVIKFQNDVSFRMSLRDEEYVGPELVQFWDSGRCLIAF
jgi:hypothetical protein